MNAHYKFQTARGKSIHWKLIDTCTLYICNVYIAIACVTWCECDDIITKGQHPVQSVNHSLPPSSAESVGHCLRIWNIIVGLRIFQRDFPRWSRDSSREISCRHLEEDLVWARFVVKVKYHAHSFASNFVLIVKKCKHHSYGTLNISVHTQSTPTSIVY